MLSQDSGFRLAALKTSRDFVICRRKLGYSSSLHSFSALRVDMLFAQQSRDDGGCGAFEVCETGAGRLRRVLLSQISGWRDHCLYPLARGCRAPRRMTPELAATAPAIPVWRYRLVAGAAELGGSVAARGACNNAVRGIRRVCSLEFRAGGMVSLSVGAWLPSAAPDDARASGHGAGNSCLALSAGGRRCGARR